MARSAALLGVFLCLLHATHAYNVSIAVVGAGFAGMAAVGRLRELGFTDITVFEGSDHFGGRVHSIPWKEGRLQQGAQWVNGRNNKIYEIASKLGLIVGEEADAEVFDDAEIHSGRCGMTDAIIKEFYDFAQPLYEKYKKMALKDENYARAMGRVYAGDYKEFMSRRTRTTQEVNLFDALSRFYQGFWEGEYGAFKNFAFAFFKDWNDGDGAFKSYVLNSIGYWGISTYLKSFVPDESIKYNHVVRGIDYSGSKIGITVEKDVSSFTYPQKFDHVIVTTSIGHLKTHARRMFNPELPERKLEAIDALGYGNLLKVFLVYEQPWWNYNNSIATLRVKDCSHASKKMNYFHTFNQLAWDDTVITGWISAMGAVAIDGISDVKLTAMITEHLREALNDPTVPEPKEMIRTHWVSNDLFYGSYSYITPEAALLPGGAYKRMAEPVGSKILFAGEGTHPHMFQTTVGAYESGVREAERLYDFVNWKL